jgi:hypothetical protein
VIYIGILFPNALYIQTCQKPHKQAFDYTKLQDLLLTVRSGLDNPSGPIIELTPYFVVNVSSSRGFRNEELITMNTHRLQLTLFALILASSVTAPVWAKKDLPAVNDEGMVLVKNSELATVYTDPNANLGSYKRVMLLDATVAFRKHWQRDQNRGYALKVKDKDMVKIQEDVASVFHEVFTQELVKGGYAMADEPGADVLLVKPAIVDLDVTAPDIASSSLNRSFSESAGEMTLNLELFDSINNEKIAKATDKSRDMWRGHLEWRTSVSNRADARRMMRRWAKGLISDLDEAHASASTTGR